MQLLDTKDAVAGGTTGLGASQNVTDAGTLYEKGGLFSDDDKKVITQYVTGETVVLKQGFSRLHFGKIVALCWENEYFPNFSSLMLRKSLLYAVKIFV